MDGDALYGGLNLIVFRGQVSRCGCNANGGKSCGGADFSPSVYPACSDYHIIHLIRLTN